MSLGFYSTSVRVPDDESSGVFGDAKAVLSGCVHERMSREVHA